MNTPLHLAAKLSDGHVTGVHAENSRPLAAQLLIGKTVDEAARLAPVVFSLCGVAQGVAVKAAADVAAGGSFAMTAEIERTLSLEAIKLHLWRLMLDWPVLFGRQPERTRFAFVLKRLDQVSDARSAYVAGGEVLDLVARELLAGFMNSLREPRNLSEFADACRRSGSIGDALARLIEAGASDPLADPVPLLAPLPASVFAAALPGGWPDAAYCRAPHLSGDVYETGPLARHVNNPLVARLVVQQHRIAARLFARVVEMSDCASRLRHPLAGDMPALVDVAPLSVGGALARIETARGVLLHALRLDGDTVADYAIVAPTEWNFRPGGVFEQEGAGWAASDVAYAEWRLRALALALDPCVLYDVSVAEGPRPMHEMSLAEGIRGIVEDAAIAQGFTKVNAVVLEVGALSSVEIEALRFCFEVVMKGTVAEGARMEVDPIAGTGWCMPCAKSVAIDQLYDPCPHCGSYQVQATGGTEMRVKALDVQTAPAGV